jgi:hypothetical protein
MEWFCWGNLQQTHDVFTPKSSGFPIDFPTIHFQKPQLFLTSIRNKDLANKVVVTCISGWWYTNPSEKYESQLG